MASWMQFEAAAPELAAQARAFFDAERHKTLATIRRDGSPRISGIEAEFVDGELQFGAMWRSVKALDLRRDPRFALHSGSAASGWRGDAKVSGRADEVVADGRAHVFRADLTEVSVVRLGDPPDHLVIDHWGEDSGLASLQRR
jgi:hypothetical protein